MACAGWKGAEADQLEIDLIDLFGKETGTALLQLPPDDLADFFITTKGLSAHVTDDGKVIVTVFV